MIDIKCIICGQDGRVPRGTPPIEHTCSSHHGFLPPVVAVLREYVSPVELSQAMERNAARAVITVLEDLADDYDRAAAVNEQQMGALRERFDRERIAEYKGERRARMESARTIRRMVLQLRLLVPNPEDLL